MMTTTLTIDPGLRGLGAALWSDDKLVWACYVKNSVLVGRGPPAHVALADCTALRIPGVVTSIILEFPQIYPGSPKTDLNDLLDVAGVASAVAARFLPAAVGYVLPREWKGTIKKEIMTARIQTLLTAEELALVERNGAKTHNTIDAVGIGLHHFKRLAKRVYV